MLWYAALSGLVLMLVEFPFALVKFIGLHPMLRYAALSGLVLLLMEFPFALVKGFLTRTYFRMVS
jgi:hypothetical protein